MTHGHVFWFLLTVGSVVWYSTITIYISVKGFADIRGMLRELQRQGDLRKERNHPSDGP